MTKTTFAIRLKQLRASKKLSQHELAEKLNIPRVAIAGYESGARSLPREQRLKSIAVFFGVSIDFLIGRSDIENESEDLEAQIVSLIKNSSLHYDYQYTYGEEEKQKIIDILLNIAKMEPQERAFALDMLSRMAKTTTS